MSKIDNIIPKENGNSGEMSRNAFPICLNAPFRDMYRCAN